MSLKTYKFNSAPLNTKNKIKIGTIHLSALSINSNEKSQMLQNTVPNIIHDRSEENATCIPKISKFMQEIPTVINTNVTDTAILFEREWKYFSTKENNNPIINPNDNDKIISINGSKTIEGISILPKLIDLAIPKLIANTTNPIASSIATTGNKISVKGPLALYCLTTINVAAGAVAVAIAPKTNADDKLNL